MWSRMLLVFSTLFIPLLIDVPFLTERYQDIFQPYASGIRSAFFGTIWVMGIAMVVSMPVSIGAAIYLEEYAAPTKTTKLIQALVTNLQVFRPSCSACLGWRFSSSRVALGSGLDRPSSQRASRWG